MTPIAIKPIVQTGNDCTIAALAMFTGQTYADVADAAVSVRPTVFRRGLWCTQIQRTAKRLGLDLRKDKRFNLDEDTGILWVEQKHAGVAHVVVLFRGVIVDSTDGQLWDPEAYFHERRSTPRFLLRS